MYAPPIRNYVLLNGPEERRKSVQEVKDEFDDKTVLLPSKDAEPHKTPCKTAPKTSFVGK